jgi:hypothetical protein
MNHVVFFRFASQDVAEEAARRLRAMEGRVPALASIEVGVDQLRTERSWDLCLITRFADAEAFAAYRVDPLHQDVLAWLKGHAEASAVVDWA